MSNTDRPKLGPTQREIFGALEEIEPATLPELNENLDRPSRTAIGAGLERMVARGIVESEPVDGHPRGAHEYRIAEEWRNGGGQE